MDKMDVVILSIETVDMHTGGEPFRINKSELPEIHGSTITEKIRYIRENLDHYRKLVIFEPRGHFDMFGVILVKPDVPGAVVGCVFIHNEGYSTMCGHGTISLGRYLIDHGIVSHPTSPETKILIQCPCGPVEVFVDFKDGKTGDVRFNSVPSYMFKKDVEIDVPGYGNVRMDIVYAGAFYAIVPASRFGLQLDKISSADFRSIAGKVKGILKGSLQLSHPENPDLAFMYGVIFTDDNDENTDLETATTCVFADNQLDRSPCGSGTCARVAHQFARGYIKLNQQRVFRSPVGSKFKAKAVKEVKYGSYDAVVVEVAGRGHYTGTSTFTLEPDDQIGKGFLLV